MAMHALVQRAVREAVADDFGQRLAEAAADALEQAWASAQAGVHQADLFHSTEALRLRLHVGERLWDGRMHPVLRRAVDHLAALGRTAAARDTAEALLRQARDVLGEEHRDVLFLRAQAAHAAGQLGEAAPAYAELARARATPRR